MLEKTTPVLTAQMIGHGHVNGQWLFRNLDLSIRPGRILAILGPNGRGKTTLLRALAGLIRPREGEVRHGETLAYVPQAGAAAFAYPVRTLVAMGRARRLGVFGTPSRADWAAADAALDAVGMVHFAGRSTDRLSGGERQLVLIARALAAEAKCLLLDEPASALDLANQGVVLRLARQLADRDGLAVIMTTHHPQHALEAADDTLLLAEPGRHAVGETAEVLDPERLSDLYGLPVRLAALPEGASSPVVIPDFGLRKGADVHVI